MPDQKNNSRNQHLNPNDSDNIRQLREQNLKNDEGSETSNQSASGTIDSLVSPSTLGISSKGTGQNHSADSKKATDQNRSGSMSGQTGSEDAAGRMSSPVDEQDVD